MDGEIPSFTGEKVNQHMANINIKIKISVKNATRHTILEKLNLSGARLYDLSGLSGKKKCRGKKMFHLNTLKFMLDACIDTLPTPANVRG